MDKALDLVRNGLSSNIRVVRVMRLPHRGNKMYMSANGRLIYCDNDRNGVYGNWNGPHRPNPRNGLSYGQFLRYGQPHEQRTFQGFLQGPGQFQDPC